MGEDSLEHIVHIVVPMATAFLGAVIAGPLGFTAAYSSVYGAIAGAGAGAMGVELYEHSAGNNGK